MTTICLNVSAGSDGTRIRRHHGELWRRLRSRIPGAAYVLLSLPSVQTLTIVSFPVASAGVERQRAFGTVRRFGRGHRQDEIAHTHLCRLLAEQPLADVLRDGLAFQLRFTLVQATEKHDIRKLVDARERIARTEAALNGGDEELFERGPEGASISSPTAISVA